MDLRTGGAIQLLAATASAAMLVFLHGGGFALPLTWPALGSVAWLAIVNSIAAFAFFFWLLRNRGGAAATSYLFIVPPATALLGVPILGQPVNAGALGGIVLAALGVAMVTWRRPTEPASRLDLRRSPTSPITCRPPSTPDSRKPRQARQAITPQADRLPEHQRRRSMVSEPPSVPTSWKPKRS